MYSEWCSSDVVLLCSGLNCWLSMATSAVIWSTRSLACSVWVLLSGGLCTFTNKQGQNKTVRNNYSYSYLHLINSVRSHLVKAIMLRNARNGVYSQVVELVTVEADLLERPGGPPSPVQKAPADWAFSERQAETQSPSQTGLFLKEK